jgi:hypothetical protein
VHAHTLAISCGSGLNLNIGRVIFHSTEKIMDAPAEAPGKKGSHEGGAKKKKGKVEASMMKQIAGRAGRRSSQYADMGLATCLRADDMPWLREAIAAPVKQVS